ncbi:Uncharacterised protein [Amycolatopsis camponoti]|uniref:Uncharacterized protein n=1 Tax=Amycolatopsis camponoti TaxID=2606593 RepID=A0A6I8LIP4_9PSEU|nr:hypothetical protein [Amycolatopsis camponoti]VVJ15515.1 Uncharacterised protein [Amycolatopsis camponoti]
MPEGNPLVVDAKKDPDGPGAFTAGNGDYGWAGGIGIAESSMDAFNGIKDGDWVSGGLGMLSLAGEIAGAAIDPFGYLMSSVASFLMEHIQPLKDMLDSIAGNPPVIQSYADTWGNVSKALGERKTDFDNAVKNGTTGWTGEGADAYRKFAAEHSEALSGAATVAGAISTVTMIMGQVVSFVRETVRQLIADLVGKLIAWVMEEVFSLGFGTPVVVAQASAAIAKWGKKIGELLKKLTDTIRKVSPLLSKLVDVFEKIAKVFGKVLGKVSGLDGLKVKEGGFVHKVPKEGGGVHTRAHGGDGADGSHSGDGDSSHSGENSGDAGHTDGDSPSSDPMNTDPGSRRSSSREGSGSPDGDSSPSRTGDGDGSPSGDNSPSHTGDGSSAHTGDSSPSRAGDSSPSPTRSPSGDGSPSPTRGADSTPSHTGDSSPSPARGADSTPSHAGDSSPSPTRGSDSTPSHTGDTSPSPTRGADSTPSHAGDNAPSRAGDSSPSPTRGSDSTPSHVGDTSPSPTRGTDSTPSHTGDTSPSPTRGTDSTPAQTGGGSPSRGGDGGSHPDTETPSSATPPRAEGTTSASGTAPTAPRTGEPGAVPSPRGGDGASVPAQGGAPMMGGGGGMPPGGGPAGGGGLGGGSPRTGGGGWTGTPGSPGAHSPHVDAPGRPRTGGDLPGGGRPRTPDAPAPAARGFGPGTHAPGTHAPDTHAPGTHAPGTRPHENGPHDGPGHHDPDGGTPHHNEPLTPDEVNARHSESTPSGSSYHAGDPEMGDLPHRVQPDPDGRYTVDVHVTPDGHARIGDRLYTPEEFADILRRNGDYDGRPVRLIGCDAGSNDFAHRLSRELDTEVMAPTKPAWTDSHGRVFSSDYEIGPDGRMRPRIPPDGEWNTHHPDGSTHRAGDDGFAPDSHHGDQHDVDADSARHRGDGDDDGSPSHADEDDEELFDSSTWDQHEVPRSDPTYDDKFVNYDRPGSEHPHDSPDNPYHRPPDSPQTIESGPRPRDRTEPGDFSTPVPTHPKVLAGVELTPNTEYHVVNRTRGGDIASETRFYTDAEGKIKWVECSPGGGRTPEGVKLPANPDFNYPLLPDCHYRVDNFNDPSKKLDYHTDSRGQTDAATGQPHYGPSNEDFRDAGGKYTGQGRAGHEGQNAYRGDPNHGEVRWAGGHLIATEAGGAPGYGNMHGQMAASNSGHARDGWDPPETWRRQEEQLAAYHNPPDREVELLQVSTPRRADGLSEEDVMRWRVTEVDPATGERVSRVYERVFVNVPENIDPNATVRRYGEP